nr:carbohydrate kinase family protein [Deinobacterium chartae]
MVALGDLAWDVLAKPDHPLLPGGDTTGRLELSGGGSAANLAVWSARLGAETVFVGKVGRDRFGELAVRDLEAEGVRHHMIWSENHRTGVVLALIDPSGQRAMLSGQGADFYLRPDELPVDLIRLAGHLHLTAWSLFTDPPRTAALEAARLAREAGATLSLDPGSYQMIMHSGRERFLEMMDALQFDILLPNRDEAQALSGREHPSEMLAWLRARYPTALIALKLDREGALIGLPDGTAFHVPATPAMPVDATGAGDAFGGAFLAHYLRWNDARAAARGAVQVAGWVVSRFGARAPVDAALRNRLAEINLRGTT